MREIKFRVWHKKNGKMATWEDIDIIDAEGLYPFLSMLGKDRYVVMQYTGLKDKNGVEIYEGDIIQYDNENYEVYWSDDWAMFTVKGCQVQALMRYADNCEVIGNIYENPNLKTE